MHKIAPFVRGKDAGTCRAGSRAAHAGPRRMPHRPESTPPGACSAAAGPRRMPPPARKHHPRGVFCCRRAPPFALTGPQSLSSGQILLPSGLAVRPHRPATTILGAFSAAAGPRRVPSPARNRCPRAAPYVPSRRKPGQMLKRERPDLDFAEKCGIFAKQRRKSYIAGGFLLF